jgi:Uncharacterized protein conserved in bacteria (DUF2147)
MKFLITAAALFAASQAVANEPFGIWQTITDETGAHLLVDVHPCEDNADNLCSTVTDVVNSPDPTAQELVGRKIFWDLEPVEENLWENGTVWDVLTDTNYDSRVILGNTAIRVEGCVSGFCDGQNWKRPEN